MDQETYVSKEMQRASRLMDFVRGEILEMHVGARLKFAKDMSILLTPELYEVMMNNMKEALKEALKESLTKGAKP